MPTVHQLLAGRNDRIDYPALVQQCPWVVEPGHDCILSPDSDGLLCGLLMSHHLGWRIRGFYDGKILVLEEGHTPAQCIFLDMEIYRTTVRSVGQHMLLYNKRRPPANWGQFSNCLSINNFRGHDGSTDFRLKYPLATVHLLIGILSTIKPITLLTTAITPLLFTDGTWMNLLGYTENSLSWLRHLRADDSKNPLATVFLNKDYPIYELMVAMDEFLRRRDEISIPRERGDRIAITLRGGDGAPHNLILSEGRYALRDGPRERGERFIRLLAELTGWTYQPGMWSWRRWQTSQFTKSDFTSEEKNLNNGTYEQLLSKNPLSFAITSTNNIEYTLEQPDTLPS